MVVLVFLVPSPKLIVNEMIDRSTVARPVKSGPQISRATPRWVFTTYEVNNRSTVNDTPNWMPAAM